MDRIPSQIISLQGEKYAIPQENLKELVRISAAEVKNKIDKIGSMPVVKLRQNFLPLLDLADVLGIQKTYLISNEESQPDRRKQIADRRSVQLIKKESANNPTDKESYIDRQTKDRRTSASSAVNIAIVYSEGYKYGLVVDGFLDSEEIEIRSIGRYLDQCGVYFGTTSLMDERAALVLDIFNIAHKAGLSHLNETINETVSEAANEGLDLEHMSLLTFRNSTTEYFAVNLDSVERLERFNSSKFEKIGSEEVIQYHGCALPVFELSQALSCSDFITETTQEVIVFKKGKKLFGLKVVPPIDTIDFCRSLDRSTFNKPPVQGSMTINNNTTLLINSPQLADILRI